MGSAMTIVQLRQKGTITLPSDLRRRYNLGEGDIFTLIDLGDGSFLLTPHQSSVAQVGDEVAAILTKEGVTAEEIIEALDQEREAYYQEHYVKTNPVSG